MIQAFVVFPTMQRKETEMPTRLAGKESTSKTSNTGKAIFRTFPNEQLKFLNLVDSKHKMRISNCDQNTRCFIIIK